MIIKKYTAGTQEEALRLAKEELGQDAVIMNIKKTKPRGFQRFFHKPSVEITAAADDNVSYDNGEKMLEEIRRIQEKEREKEHAKEQLRSLIQDEEKESSQAIEEKLDNLQDMLKQQIIEKQDEEKEEEVPQESGVEKEKDRNEVCYELIKKQMLKNEVIEEYVDGVIEEIRSSMKKDSSLDTILASVYQKIILKLGQTRLIELPSSYDEDKEGHCKYVFFIGPTGVGKTTTIAKIASSFQLKRKAKTALVTSDTYRIAAVEQLKTYGNIMGIPLKVIYSPDELKDSMAEFEDFDLVLIDTAGRSHKKKEQRDDIELLIQSVPPERREVYLVLSATTKYNDLVSITKIYHEITDYHIIFTKLDETDCIGNIFNVRLLTNAPLSYATWGQNVPEDIGVVNPQKIAKQLLGGNN